MDDLTVLNLELCVAWMNTAIKEIHECIEYLDKAQENIKEVREIIEEKT